MDIIVDSGSTQSTWLLTGKEGTRELHTQGINALLHTEEQILSALAGLPPCEEVRKIRFYGAGCGPAFPEAGGRLRRILCRHFGTADIDLESDLTAAARALFGDGEGIACILGTGSNSGHCRNGSIVTNVPPLGYILGDEGSGSALGRRLLNGLFKGHIPLKEEFLDTCGLTCEQTLRRVYREPFANRFLASLVPFIADRIDRPEMRETVLACFSEFADRNLSRYPSGLPAAFVGGVAVRFEPLLREAMQKAGRDVAAIVKSPAEGLLKYHYGA